MILTELGEGLIEFTKYILDSRPDDSKNRYLKAYNEYKEPKIPLEFLQKEAEKGEQKAQYYLGLCYMNEKGLPKDLEKAAELFQKSAVQGWVLAQYMLGRCYEYAWGVPKDLTEAVKWYRMAAEQGYPSAKYDLEKTIKCIVEENTIDKTTGVPNKYKKYIEILDNGELIKAVRMYKEDNNIPFIKAKEIIHNLMDYINEYRIATQLNDIEAQYNIAVYYENGKVVTKDIDEAVKWYKKAAEQGCLNAKSALERLGK